MGNRITGIVEAREAIIRAIAEGVFVPVLGFDIAASTTYADTLSGGFGTSSSECSPQHRELAKVAARLSLLRAHLRAAFDDSDLARDPSWLAHEYLEDMSGYYCGKYGLDDVVEAEECTSPPVFRFQVAIARLVAVLTAAWADDLARSPKPVSSAYSSHASPVEIDGPYFQAFGLLRETLDVCLTVIEEGPPVSSLEKKEVYFVYGKLLRLAAQVPAADHHLWENTEFRTRHMPKLTQLLRRGFLVGWEVPSDGYPRISHTTVAGIGMAHLYWVEELLRYTLLAETRAYRRRSELAFALSLDDIEIGIPRFPADAFEIGLLYSAASTHDLRVIHDTLNYCAGSNNEMPRKAGGFHRLLAMICRQTIDRATSEKSLVARKQIMISLGMDQELERAIEEQFDVYRVLIPVSIAVRGNMGTQAEEPGRGRSQHVTRPIWLLGKVSRGGEGTFETDWIDTSNTDVDIAGDGPLIIKLFGSPAHSLPSPSAMAANPNFDPTAPRPNPSHRLVLDEMGLMNLLFRLYPDESHVRGLTHRLRSSRLFFFGQDAVTWGDRIPYMIVDAIRGSSDATGAVGGWGSGRDAAAPESRHGAVAIGQADEPTRGVMRRLGVVEVDALHAPPARILKMLADEFANQEEGGRS
jgi:hypothetical protein